MLTKDEVSDLKSHIGRVVETEKELQMAERRLADAKRNLETFLHNQQYPMKDK